MTVERGGWTFLKSPDYVFASLTGKDQIRVPFEYVAREIQRRWREKLSQTPSPNPQYLYDVYFAIVKGPNGKVLRPVATRMPPHQASSPGEPPAIDTGKAVESIRIKRVVFPAQPKRVRYIIYTDLAYLAYLEWGMGGAGYFPHPVPGKIVEPRPHVRPMLRENLRGLQQDFVGRLQGTLVPPKLQPRTLKQIRSQILKFGAITGTLAGWGLAPRWLKNLRNYGYTAERMIGNLEAIREGPDAIARRVRNVVVGRQVGKLFNSIVGPTRPGTDPFVRKIKREARVFLGRKASFLFK